MCGIGGVVRFHHPGDGECAPPLTAIPEGWLDLLDEGIAHRGPDGRGRFRDRVVREDGATVDVALVHRRLTILDAAGGAQPMVWRDRSSPRRLAVVFNGLIYNHLTLRRELESEGARFASDHSDTETLLHAWHRWGPGKPGPGGEFPGAACERLSDMFAFAVWDSATGSLFLARDRFGQKPLYWTALDGSRCWAFASVAGALYPLMRAAGAPIAPSPGAAARWVRFGAWRDPPVVGVRAVTPSCVVRFHGEDPDETTFTPGPLARGCGRDRPLTIATLDEAIRRAVRERLEADVPLGCFLSGGVDSSLIASYAQEVKPDLATFTVRMPDPGLDESNAAEQIAAALGTSHTTLECGATPAEDLPRLIAQTGLPFGDSSLLPTHWLSRAVRRHATVALSGDGGDELFAGYDRHAAAARVGPYARLLAHYPFGPGPGTRSRRARAARLADACRHDGYLDLVSVFPRSMLAQLGVEAPAEAPVAWDVGAALAHDQGHYLPDDLLVKSDSAAMAAALEVRSPLLDARVVALANGAPVATLMPGGERKGLLRALARRRLPAPAMDRPKQGFAIPVGGWFRTDFGGMGSLLGDTLSSADPLPVSALGCAIDLRYARRLLDEHLGGARDHSQRLYVLLVLALYARALTATR